MFSVVRFFYPSFFIIKKGGGRRRRRHFSCLVFGERNTEGSCGELRHSFDRAVSNSAQGDHDPTATGCTSHPASGTLGSRLGWLIYLLLACSTHRKQRPFRAAPPQRPTIPQNLCPGHWLSREIPGRAAATSAETHSNAQVQHNKVFVPDCPLL